MTQNYIEEGERFFRELADNAPVMIWRARTDKLCDWFNKPWLDFVGRTMEQEAGNGWAEGVHQDDFHRCLNIYTTAFDARERFSMIYRLRRHDGVFRDILDNGAPFYRGDEFAGYFGSCIDVTERQLASEGLAESEQKFRLLVQGVSDYALYMLDPEGNVTNWNVGAQRIKGYRPEEIIGRNFSQFYTPEDREAGEPQRALRIAAEEGRFEKEAQRVRKDGTRFWANVVIDPIRDPSGQLIGFAKITRDVTERKESQAALEKTREALFQSQKVEAIGQLTGGIAHDFNNLLMAVLGSLELVRKRQIDDPRIKMLLDNAFEGAKRGVSLTQRMLAFARRQELSLKNVNLRDLVQGMADLMERSLGPQIVIDNEISSDLPDIKADANQLESALLNLAVNARDAMPSGGTIRLTANQEHVSGETGRLKRGEYVRLSIADTGEGMDERTLSRAVEPFFTTKDIGKGTGLGLSMVHGMIEQIGGRLDIKSKRGEGTIVDLWLPVTDDKADVVALEIEGAPASVRTKRKVLAVDDDRLVLVNTVAMLEELECDVLQASSGKQALEVLKDHPDIDLVVTDQLMPQMTGLQLAKEIRKDHPELAVLLVSGFAELETDADLGISKLSKPFTFEDLEKAIGSCESTLKSGGNVTILSSYKR